ncbi:heparan-alpha-glucosaminide N-acetyltransferase domain-containing protein [Sutcliffiella rhizosphaerae]|uniref:Heparan-alpha-glucosaminide N-acetyltransferase catalytic domain-containing protein n=1 Tax=Sutcliffiella rhizosphaerae TaxID=2880967 RepID=A0ABN8A8G6_9BACI|nr:heparan-alpha-glucosaminide N-acetyltransferase domain-containing protein [Sutcliffiella rhizosphaerae]CAG9621405.1 hypothetical protein BACCIP111883_02178 [Sutcliffiella rhizosphaerae]
MGENNLQSKKRFRSIDVTRGIVVLLAIFVSALPGGGYEYLRHAYWYGVTVTDLIFPAFLTVYGIGLAIAYRNGVKWKNLIRRTIMLIVYGLLFNLIASWSLDLQTLRYTGVLQLFAVTGLGVVIISRIFKSWKWAMVSGLIIATIYTTVLVITSTSCEGGIPRTSCNLSGVVDSMIFGENHVYAQGERGFDPEGIFSVFSAMSNVLFGYAIGMVIHNRKKIMPKLIMSGIGLVLLSFVFQQFIDFNKRLWSPSFALLASGILITLLAIMFFLIDNNNKNKKKGTFNRGLIWYLESIGRNSFLIYFGKMVVFIIFGKLVITLFETQGTLSELLFNLLNKYLPFPHLFYSLFFIVIWSLIAIVLHAKKKYIRA